jgi:hypothetical protein
MVIAAAQALSGLEWTRVDGVNTTGRRVVMKLHYYRADRPVYYVHSVHFGPLCPLTRHHSLALFHEQLCNLHGVQRRSF